MQESENLNDEPDEPEEHEFLQDPDHPASPVRSLEGAYSGVKMSCRSNSL